MKHIVIEPVGRHGKFIVARRAIGGKYRGIAECRSPEVAAQIVDALNKSQEKS